MDKEKQKMDEKKENNENLWLLGRPIEKLNGDKLPSNLEVLTRFYSLHLKDPKGEKCNCASLVTMEILTLWDKTGIAARRKDHVSEQISKLHRKYLQLKKRRNNPSNGAVAATDEFAKSLPDLFDITHADAIKKTERGATIGSARTNINKRKRNS